MSKKNILLESVIIIFVLQGTIILLKKAENPFIGDNSFAERMFVMTDMILLSIITVLYAKFMNTKFSLFPDHFSKFYIILTVIASVIIIGSPSNYTDGYKSILLLLYGSIVTPVFEELIFRGYLWNRLNKVFSKELYTYIWSTFLFTVWHLGYMIPQIMSGNWFAVITKLIAGLIYGMILGYVRMKFKNCYITMILHGILNTVMI